MNVHLKRLGWGACAIVPLFSVLWTYASLPEVVKTWIEWAVGIGILTSIIYLCGMAIEFVLEDLDDLKETLGELEVAVNK